MNRITRKASAALAKVKRKQEREGVLSLTKTIWETAAREGADAKYAALNPEQPTFYDVAFINGCDYSVPHPIRYRVRHQIEQLMSNGLTATLLEAGKLTLADVSKARTFVVFRCPSTPEVERFIALAKMLNKKVFYDIDDLVIDTKYTDAIPYLDIFSPEERAGYDDGVRRMGRTLQFCDGAITSTEGMATELSNYVSEVFINRNTASEDMIYYSEKALYERDVFPTLNARDVARKDRIYQKWVVGQRALRESRGCVIGYFSGSITHNDDFSMILPALLAVLDMRPDVMLKILGELDIPQDLEPYRDRIITDGFISWKELPEAIASVDINIAPLVKTVFNEAKSENKWIEAALVKVPTVASNIGAFKRMIDNGQTGVLVENDMQQWRDALLGLVDHPEARKEIGARAYEYCHAHCTTIKSGGRIASFIQQHQTPNLFFNFPTLNVSGGVLVALKHCCILQDAGYDVAIIDESGDRAGQLFTHGDNVFPVYAPESTRNYERKMLLEGSIDVGVATLFSTLDFFERHKRPERILYFVQNYETDFYNYSHPLRIEAQASYRSRHARFITISKWCQNWLKSEFGQDSLYVANGIDLDAFYPVQRKFDDGKVRVLIEGDSESDYKNVDEAFRIANLLDRDKFEIWYLSYNGQPKDWYKCDRFFCKVPHEHVGDVYRQCHILLKTSLLESFSYPPLEMMATGGFVVAIPNEGNAEYLVDGENCVMFEHGDIEAGLACINQIASDAGLRATLYEAGVKCAKSRSWDKITGEIVRLYAE